MIDYLFIKLSIPLNSLSIKLSIKVIVYNTTLLLKAHANPIAIIGKIANSLNINKYVKLLQNIIQKEQPNGAFRYTDLILPFDSHPAIIPAIVFG